MNEVDRKYHEVANIFPLMQNEEFEALKVDIENNGLLEPIWLHGQEIIDGRNRHRACIETETPMQFRTWQGKGSLISFVVSMNLHRRHLSSGQRATLAVELLPMFEEEAKERQGLRADIREIIPTSSEGRATEQVAEVLQTNHRYVQDAKKLKEESPDLFEQVKAGEVSLPEAKRQLNPAHVSNNSGNNEWYTPEKYITAARLVMGSIDLDPASSDIANSVVRSIRYYSLENNGLLKKWFGNVWMNPPYSQPSILEFTNKFIEEWKNKNIKQACVLVNNATETKWGSQLLYISNAVCFISGRVKFLDTNLIPHGAPLQGQMILYYGENVDLFKVLFSDLGVVKI